VVVGLGLEVRHVILEPGCFVSGLEHKYRGMSVESIRD
jgi:hypothetical protein